MAGQGDSREDEDTLFGPRFNDALRDYRYLLNRGYPQSGALRLVGDRRRLTGEQRMILYRGVCSTAAADRRRQRLAAAADSAGDIYIDGYNIVFLLLNYRLGRPVFVSDDGFVRDAGGAHGRISKPELLEEAAAALCLGLAKLGRPSELYLDRPVSGSLRHAALFGRIAAAAGAPVRCEVVPSADRALEAHPEGCIATSDSTVIDRHLGPVLDLSPFILKLRYGAEATDISSIR